MKISEKFIKNIRQHCDIVEIDEIKVIGIKVSYAQEIRGNLTEYGANTIRETAKKYITNGTVQIIADLLNIESPQYIAVRTNIKGDGVHDIVIGIVVDSFDNVPEYMPEYTVQVICPACRYACMAINETKSADREGFNEQMAADEYFIGKFRTDTPYVYDKSGVPFNTFDENGEFLAKYEPIKIPADDNERFDSMVLRMVSLPDILCACSTQGPGDDEFVIFKYFGVQDQVFPLECAKMYNDDYYGFPFEISGVTYSCFGSRVSSYDGLPDCVSKLTIKSGLYLHISQLELNGDNPSMPYDVAFNHLDKIFFTFNPQYERDNSKHVIARFRQANCASVFVPIKLKG